MPVSFAKATIVLFSFSLAIFAFVNTFLPPLG